MTFEELMNDPYIRDKMMSLNEPDLEYLKWRSKWKHDARHNQLPTEDPWWDIWLILAGRGFGKTRAAAEWLANEAWRAPGTRWLVSAPTFGDLEKVCFNGESGLLQIIPPHLIKKFNKTDLELELRNGSLIQGISAEKPERFRGPQFHGGWLDELAAWQYINEAFELLMLGMRLGKHPRLVCTTTPKPKPLIRELVKREGKDVYVSRGSTYDNKANLAPTMFRQITKYDGTQIGRQEIYGELLDPSEGAIVKRSHLMLWPAGEPLPYFEYILASLDTAFTEETRDKKTGDPDFTACTVWGVFRDGTEYGFMLLNCWQERIGFPDLVLRAKKELKANYGRDARAPIIQPLIGPNKVTSGGQKPDSLLIEAKGSGISLIQVLYREGVPAYSYNPGKAKKVERLHAVSHLFANGMVYLQEDAKNEGQPLEWYDPWIDQITTFSGEKSIEHDDFVDSTTQALRYLSDAYWVTATEVQEFPEDLPSGPEKVYNPYAA